MNCCEPTKIEFVNVESTTIAYDAVMQEKYGSKPNVIIYYLDPSTNQFVLSDFPLQETKIVGGNIIIDHGGPATGIVVIR